MPAEKTLLNILQLPNFFAKSFAIDVTVVNTPLESSKQSLTHLLQSIQIRIKIIEKFYSLSWQMKLITDNNHN